MFINLFTTSIFAITKDFFWDKYIGDINSISADFIQETRTDDGFIMQKSSGEMIIQRPNQLKWNTFKPQVVSIIADGKYIWYYEKDINQAIKYNIQRLVGASPLQVLWQKYDEILQTFNTELVQNRDGYVLILTPKLDSVYKQVKLYIHDEKIFIIEFQDSLSQITQIKLSKVTYNKAYTPATFEFNLPKNAELIDQSIQ